MLTPNITVYGRAVKIRRSDEQGVVTGFARHQRQTQVQYYVEYTTAKGEAHERWLFEDELVAV